MNRMPPSQQPGSIFQKIETKAFRLLRTTPPTDRLAISVFWLAILTLCTFLLAWIPGAVGDIFASLATFTFLAVLVGLVPITIRWVRWHMLWELRNRLRVTYLLIGLAPVVLFGMMIALAGYVFSGQFANFAATAEIDTQLEKFDAGNQALAAQVAHRIAHHSKEGRIFLSPTFRFLLRIWLRREIPCSWRYLLTERASRCLPYRTACRCR